MGQPLNMGLRHQSAAHPEQEPAGPRLVGPPESDPPRIQAAGVAESQNFGSPLALTSQDRRIDRIAQSRISVLIVGETGAGKEVLAKRIHDSSLRSNKPLVSVNCAAVCDSLIDSELFGYQRGAFTGAEQSRVGLIEAADGGTLFLDEIGELSLTAQTKLLRVLETRQVLRVGAVATRPVDVRFIAATNRDLDVAIAAGGFRDDLLFRLEGIRLLVPPLRSRVDEIVPAARQFLRELARRDRLPLVDLTDAAQTALQQHVWRGNFRELRNVVERAALMCADGKIEPGDLLLAPETARRGYPVSPPPPHPPHPSISPELAGSSAAPGRGPDRAPSERERIVTALKDCAGNQTRAAKLLGISRRTLVTRLERFDLARPRARPLRAIPLPGVPAARREALCSVAG